MYGPPQAPQSPKSPASGGLIALRVLFAALPLLSCGFLAWAPLLRLAVVTRRALDWALCGLAFLAGAALFAYAVVTGEEEGSTLEAFVGIGTITVLAAGSVTYYLVAEIRHFERLRALPEQAPPPYRPMGYSYGADGSAVTVPSPGAAPNPYICAPPPEPQPAAPQPATPPAPRIAQVRAELDELSDLLRKETPEGDDRR
ncbi:hypothetical protein ACFVZH_22185 [Streptomyces sp. NPDC059534]|uniref:hypothetical protein n=1 Tax=Streptomyces sp. NPDC059534 TaxID=3346859 RepID=UPI003683035E